MTTESKTERIEIEYPAMFTRVYREKTASPILGFAPCEINGTPIIIPDDDLRYMYIECAACGKSTWQAGLKPTARNEDEMCDDCIKEHAMLCADCGAYFLFDHPDHKPHGRIVRLVDGTHKPVCGRCINYDYSRCSKCGEYHHSSGMRSVTEANSGRRQVLCPGCYDRYMATRTCCHNCGKSIDKISAPVHSGRAYCASCFKVIIEHELSNSYAKPRKHISGYCHTPGTVFVSTVGGAIRYYGLEIEAENGIDDSGEQPKELLEELFPWIEFILKEDGSIEGFETVSVPLTLNYIRDHLRLYEWSRIMKKYNFKSDESANAGLHVHISKNAFGDTIRKKNKAIAAFLYLFQREDFRTQLETFSRRRGHNHYCRFYPTYEVDYSRTTITRALPKALAYNKHNRNCMMNFHIYREGAYRINENTVELRLFKGSLRRSTIVATVELMDLFADIATAPWTEESLRALTWADICNKVPATSTCLKSYLMRNNIWEGN